MASFTDNSVLDKLTNFAPYVQQLPVEAMVSVGQQKQKQYNEGIQKIQTSIDNIAGLDIGRDVDKAYLQSKVNELGNNLKFVAAGDFSDFQLVNSVNGMTGNIVKDNIIKSAVTSTANDRKQIAEMDADKKAGKLTPQAEYYYNLQRNEYYNNSDLTTKEGTPISFNGKYTQSWDIDKNILEAIKAVGDSEWSADNVFKMVNGQIAKDPNTGAPIYSDYAIREKRKGKFSENVSAAIDGVLTRPEATQELTMRGIYNYRGRNNIDDFVNEYEETKNKNITKLEGHKIEFMEKVANATNKDEKLKYQEIINSIDSKIEATKQEAVLKETEAQQFNSVEGYKAALETLKVRNNYMLSGVTEKTSSEIIENIPYKAQREVLKDERDWWAKKETVNMGWANVDIAKKKQKLEETKWDYDPKNPNNILAPTEQALPLGNTFQTEHGNLINASNQAENVLDATKFSIVTEYMSAINFGNGKKLTQLEIEDNIKKYEKNTPGFIDRMYDRAKSISMDKDLARSPLYSKLMSSLPAATTAENEMTRLATTTTNMNNSNEVVSAGGKDVDMEAITKNFKPFEVEYSTEADKKDVLFGGNRGLFQSPKITKKTITAQDAVDLAIIAGNTGGLQGIWRTLTNTPTEKAQYESADNRIKAKFEIDGRELLKQTRQITTYSAGMAEIPVLNKSMQTVFNTVSSQKFSNVLNAKEEYLKNHTWSPQPIAYSIYNDNMIPTERTSVDDRVKVVLNAYKDVGGLEEFNKIYTDPKNFNAQITVDRGSTFSPKQDFSLNLYDKSGLVKSIPITKDYADYVKGGSIKLPPRISETMERIQANGSTTNSDGLPPNHPDAYQGAMIPGTFFAQKLNTTKVLGAEVIVSPSGGYNAYLYTIDPRTNDTIGIPIKANKDDIYPANFATGDAATEYLVNKINSKAYAEGLINNGL